jgi:hypothetical protein
MRPDVRHGAHLQVHSHNVYRRRSKVSMSSAVAFRIPLEHRVMLCGSQDRYNSCQKRRRKLKQTFMMRMLRTGQQLSNIREGLGQQVTFQTVREYI